MSKLDPNLKLNQIHIPGTHDSGTFAINLVAIKRFVETQNLYITEQLENGIRYLDITVSFEDIGDEIYISHNFIPCFTRKNHKLYLRYVLNDCMKFLMDHPYETIVTHISRENVDRDTITDYNFDC
ncbi:PLC-like phosphodiesterase [Neocallimastix californiae]|uniref:PLC-like phosphodiesterase n=1 Tax=Neocallimastix californiae TaxID=1754190 RepID=A0A1Y2ACG2_9FUNG|nr:PLC-like phosphodiesterase [Neocallimastix californiae]|eukprot:ORY20253.1 PLC-like phosphodiesterase [Neocallimastix californiae]